MAECHAARLHLAGGQEARNNACQYSTQLYRCFYSEHSSGALGCSIWVARALSWGTKDDRPIHIAMNQIIVVHADPRRLGIAISSE
eukprot:6067484-Lingulodinium_polyedra.AAC.1